MLGIWNIKILFLALNGLVIEIHQETENISLSIHTF